MDVKELEMGVNINGPYMMTRTAQPLAEFPVDGGFPMRCQLSMDCRTLTLKLLGGETKLEFVSDAFKLILDIN